MEKSFSQVSIKETSMNQGRLPAVMDLEHGIAELTHIFLKLRTDLSCHKHWSPLEN